MSNEQTIRVLFDKYLEGTLSADKDAELAALLAEEPALKDCLLDLVLLDSVLREQGGELCSSQAMADAVKANIQGLRKSQQMGRRVRRRIRREERGHSVPKRRPLLWFALATAAGIVVAAVFTWYQLAQPAPGTPISCVGDVTASSGQTVRQLSNSDVLREGEIVRVSDWESRAAIVHSPDNVVTLLGKGGLSLTRGNAADTFRVLDGTIDVRIQSSLERDLIFATPHSSFRITGTALTIVVTPSNTTASVEKGRVAMLGDQPRMIDAGEFVAIDDGGVLQPVPANLLGNRPLKAWAGKSSSVSLADARSQSIQATYKLAGDAYGNWAVIGRTIPRQDWRAYKGISFRFRGAASGAIIHWEIITGSTESSVHHIAGFRDKQTGVRRVALMFEDFNFREMPESKEPSQELDLEGVIGFYVLVFSPVENQKIEGSLTLDEIQFLR